MWLQIVGLAILTALVSWASTCFDGWWGGFLSNLGAGFAGSLVTVVLVELSIERGRKKDMAQVRRIAFDGVRSKITNHLENLLKLQIASPPQGAVITNKARSIDEMFSTEYFDKVSQFNLFDIVPLVFPQQKWSVFLRREAMEFIDALSKTIDKYIAYLSPESIAAIEGVVRSSFLGSLNTLGDGRVEAVDSELGIQGRSMHVFRDKQGLELVKIHILEMLALIREFNEYGSNKIDINDIAVWRCGGAKDF